jgi:hypothetical protein
VNSGRVAPAQIDEAVAELNGLVANDTASAQFMWNRAMAERLDRQTVLTACG